MSTSGPFPDPTASPMKSMGASSRSPSPMTTVPLMSTMSKTRRIAVTAAWSAAFLSPRPIHRAQESAAASVMRTSSRPMLWSMGERSAARRFAEHARVHFFPVVQGVGPPVKPNPAGGLGVGVDVLHEGAAGRAVGVVELLVHHERAGGAGQLHPAHRAPPDHRLDHGVGFLVLGLVEFEVAELLVELAQDLFPALVVHLDPRRLVDLRSEPLIVAHLVRRTTAPGSGGPFSHRSALVLGGSRGLGRAVALALARAGARVLITGRDASALAETQAIARARGVALAALRSDAGSKIQVRAALRRATKENGAPDLLVHAVGDYWEGPVA